MAKLSNTSTALPPKDAKKAPLKSGAKKNTVTHEGAPAFSLKTKSELFTLAATLMVGEDKFYESADKSTERFVNLIHEVTKSDPVWMQGFIPYLRNEMFMRTGSVVAAAEYAAAGGPNIRLVVNSALQRADEPAELLAYWVDKYGYSGKRKYPLPAPKIPQGVRKGLQDAAVRLYNEYSVMKYNGNSRAVSMGNVLNLVHPTPKDEAQAALFKYVIDRHHENPVSFEGLPKIGLYNKLNKMDVLQRELELNSQVLADAGMTWESLSAWGPMDSKRWEMVIPSMGYMALLRNLRNFEQAGISKRYVKKVVEKLTDPAEVARSKQFPFRFLSAYKNTHSLLWASALEEALDLSVQNIPELEGSSQIYVDVSGSMNMPLSSKSSVQLWEAGALFGVACFYRFGGDTEVIAFGTTSKKIDLPKGGSVLKGIQQANDQSVGWGTNLGAAIKKHYDGQERVVVFTDCQIADQITSSIPNKHFFMLGGYRQVPLELGGKGSYGYGGFSDKTFSLMKILEETGSGNWPWEPRF